jgi:prolyl-tRNA editing enzyme YbaK/EbsC (Cys-tRNA(Pro) deacylase)
MTDNALSASAQKVQSALQQMDLPCEVVELSDSTRTAVEAAAAIGCTVSQIVKSLIFRGKSSGKGVLVLASGTNRVDEKLVAAVLGEAIDRADPDFVREQTGYAIGGVPPLAHDHPMTALIDRDLLQFDEIWAAAGTPHAVFRLKPADLERMTGGQLADIKKQ